jgi:hypothetical protein
LPILGLVGVILLGFIVRVYRLDELPAAAWGDLIEHYRLVKVVWAGKLQISTWFGGDGPVFPLLAAGFTRIVGLSFLHLKLFSALTGTGLIGVTYLYAEALFSKRVALMAAAVSAVSFWSISYSRLGKPYILVAALFGGLLYLLIKQRWIWAGVVMSLGMLTQASFWGALLLSMYRRQTAAVAWSLSAPVFFKMMDVFDRSAYLGDKLDFQLSTLEFGRQLGINIVKNVGGFFWQGSPGFRATIPGAPLLDPLSGIFFAVGLAMVVWWVIKAGKQNYLKYILLPFIAVQIPSLLDVANYRYNPNSGRMIGVLPVAYMLVALGLVTIGEKVKKRWIRGWFYGLSLCLIASMNIWNYFAVYPNTLPNDNVPFGRTIATYINASFPQIERVVMVGCCWGERGQPEPDSIRYELLEPERFTYVPEKDSSLNAIEVYSRAGSLMVVFRPNEHLLQAKLARLYPEAKMHALEAGGWQIAQMIVIDK